MTVAKLNLNQEIKKVEKRLNDIIVSNDPVIEEAALDLLASGGKRIRPAFVVLSSQFGEHTTEDTYRIAVALELIHMATLVHDDVIDKSDKRRGKPTIAKQWDQDIAILTGNFLLALALEHISTVKHERVHHVISHAILDVCRGELFQFQDQFNANQNVVNYLRRFNRKTALLIQLSTEVGAITADADDKTVHKLKRIGHYIGMSFQIMDDILDFTSTEKQLGKPVGSDLLNGHITLPVLLEMRNNSEFKQRIQQLNANSPKEEFQHCINIIRASSVIEEAQRVSDHYLAKTLDLIESLGNEDAKKLFNKIINKMAKRNK